MVSLSGVTVTGALFILVESGLQTISDSAVYVRIVNVSEGCSACASPRQPVPILERSNNLDHVSTQCIDCSRHSR